MNVQRMKSLTGVVTALSVGAMLAVSSTSAEARYGRKGVFLGGIAAGIAGAAIAGRAIAGPRYYGYEVRPAYRYYPECWMERRPVYNRWGDFRGYRPIRVCE